MAAPAGQLSPRRPPHIVRSTASAEDLRQVGCGAQAPAEHGPLHPGNDLLHLPASNATGPSPLDPPRPPARPWPRTSQRPAEPGDLPTLFSPSLAYASTARPPPRSKRRPACEVGAFRTTGCLAPCPQPPCAVAGARPPVGSLSASPGGRLSPTRQVPACLACGWPHLGVSSGRPPAWASSATRATRVLRRARPSATTRSPVPVRTWRNPNSTRRTARRSRVSELLNPKPTQPADASAGSRRTGHRRQARTPADTEASGGLLLSGEGRPGGRR